MQVCCTLDDLAEQFQTRISMLKDRLTLRDMSSEPSCVLMCSSIYSMLGDVDGMLILMKSEVARRKITVDRAKVGGFIMSHRFVIMLVIINSCTVY